MPSFSRLVTLAATTGDIDGVSAGTVTAGPALSMHHVAMGTLAAVVTVDAETNTLTMAAVWEASEDGTTWSRLVQPNAAAEVVLATGTSGADAAVTRAISAPPGAYAFRHVRCSILSGVATGTTSDTYSIAYRYVKE